jgi:hypothetical protein
MTSFFDSFPFGCGILGWPFAVGLGEIVAHLVGALAAAADAVGDGVGVGDALEVAAGASAVGALEEFVAKW